MGKGGAIYHFNPQEIKELRISWWELIEEKVAVQDVCTFISAVLCCILISEAPSIGAWVCVWLFLDIVIQSAHAAISMYSKY